jgi:hypothetical protein
MKNTAYKIPDYFWTGLIAAFTLVVHMATYNTLGFHRDELLYLAVGRHPAAGYWSNPPFIGIVSYFLQLLPGKTLFILRLFPALAGALLIIITGLMTRELGGKTYAQVLACISLAISIIFMRVFSMFQPVCFDMLFWSIILYTFLRFLNTEKPVYLILLGVAFGFGFLNKYMVIFLAAGLAIAVIPTSYRKLWINKYAWLAILIALLLFLPNIIWQYTHGFPVLHHMRELKETQLVNVRRINIILDQILMFTISSLVWVAGLIWLIRSADSKKFRVFGYAYLAILLIFILLRGKSYYMAGMYPILFAAGGVSWEMSLKRSASRIFLVLFIILLTIPILPGAIPYMSAPRLVSYFSGIPPKMGGEALVRWEDGKMHPLPQDYADMLGWDELGGIVVKACDTIKDKKRLMIYCENYGQAGAVDYFGRGHNLPEAISFADAYRLWVPDTISKSIDVFLYVNDELGADVDSLFSNITVAGSIKNPYAREKGTTVYICRGPRGDFPAFWKRRVLQVINQIKTKR